MSFIINPYAFAAENFLNFHAFASEHKSTSGGDGSESGNLSIGAAPTGTDRRFVIGMWGLIDDSAQQFTTSVLIGGSGGTTIANCQGGSNKSSTWIEIREISSGTTTTLTSQFVGTPTVSEQYWAVLSFLTGPDGYQILDSDSGESASTSLGVSQTMSGLSGHDALVCAVGAARAGTGLAVSTATLQDESISGTKVFGAVYDFNLNITSRSIRFDPDTTTSIGQSVLALAPA